MKLPSNQYVSILCLRLSIITGFILQPCIERCVAQTGAIYHNWLMKFIADRIGAVSTGYIDWNDKHTFFITSTFFLILCLVFWFILHNCVYYLVSSPILSFIKSRFKLIRKSPKNDQLEKLHISIWKIVNYGLLSIIGLLVIWSGAFEHPSLGVDGNIWVYDYESYCIPISKIPLLMVLHYQLTIASYIYGIYTLLFVEHRMKDFWQMIAHHIVTLCLTIGSYYIERSIRIGCVVMILHDLCDPILESAKCFNYLDWKRMANATFAIFAVVFVILRCFIYPLYVILPIFNIGVVNVVPNGYMYGYMLFSILVLNLFWATLIIRMVFRQIATGYVGGDIRED